MHQGGLSLNSAALCPGKLAASERVPFYVIIEAKLTPFGHLLIETPYYPKGLRRGPHGRRIPHGIHQFPLE